MTVEQYQENALITKKRIDAEINVNLVYPALKLAGEAGEVVEKIGKIIRDKQGLITEDDARALLLELGDVLWYVNSLAHELGADLTTVMIMNINKLRDRAERGVIHGSGDNR